MLAACGDQKPPPPPAAATTPTPVAAITTPPDAAPAGPKPPPAPLVPAAGACRELLEGSGPIECPYDAGAPGKRRARDDLAMPFERGGSCESAGRLRLTSGRVVATDPLVFLDAKAFTTTFAPGAYPVILAMHHGDVSHALLRIGDARPVRWRQALLPGERPKPGRVYRYPVDAGTGSYVDDETAREIERRESAISDHCAAHTKATVDPADGDAWHRVMRECQEALGPDLYELLRRAGYHTRAQWANACVDPATGANLIAFSSGAGDGSYPVFVGLDARGTPVALVTDFGILGDEDEE